MGTGTVKGAVQMSIRYQLQLTILTADIDSSMSETHLRRDKAIPDRSSQISSFQSILNSISSINHHDDSYAGRTHCLGCL